MKRSHAGTLLLCTQNDPESLLICEIARSAGIPLFCSKQQHGALLSREGEFMNYLARIPQGTEIVIVEIPGVPEEEELRRRGYAVVTIDHHAYPEINRLHEDASLTQFLRHFSISDEDLSIWGYDPVVVHGVAAIDKGFLWELARIVPSEKDRRRIRAQYVAYKAMCNPDIRYSQEAAERVWKKRSTLCEGVVFLDAREEPLRIREEVSFLLADAFPEHPPQTIVFEVGYRQTVQETPHAHELFQRFGGYLFGGGFCWGRVGSEDSFIPVEELLLVLKK